MLWLAAALGLCNLAALMNNASPVTLQLQSSCEFPYSGSHSLLSFSTGDNNVDVWTVWLSSPDCPSVLEAGLQLGRLKMPELIPTEALCSVHPKYQTLTTHYLFF